MDAYDYIPADEPVCLNCDDEGCEYCDDYDYEDDGQPDEYTEWQDVYGGDDWDNGQYDDVDEYAW
jgi:hypothetical protein